MPISKVELKLHQLCNYTIYKIKGYKPDYPKGYDESPDRWMIDRDYSFAIPNWDYIKNWPYEPYFVIRNFETDKSLYLHYYDDGTEPVGPVEKRWFPTEEEWKYVVDHIAMHQQKGQYREPWTFWDMLKFYWNDHDIPYDTEYSYYNYEIDDKYKGCDWYIPMSLKMPNWKRPIKP